MQEISVEDIVWTPSLWKRHKRTNSSSNVSRVVISDTFGHREGNATLQAAIDKIFNRQTSTVGSGPVRVPKSARLHKEILEIGVIPAVSDKHNLTIAKQLR